MKLGRKQRVRAAYVRAF